MRDLSDRWQHDMAGERDAEGGAGERLRVALYAHDSMGLGHTRRNLLVARALVERFEHVEVLLIAGSREVARFERIPKSDVLVLPALHKDAAGDYRSRDLSLSLERLTRLRSDTICAALASFDPHLLIVDNVPGGANGEMLAPLRSLRGRGRTAVVLGLRDILDAPEAVRQQWDALHNERVIAELYDAVWIYGDREMFDAAAAYRFAPSTVAKLRYLGYLERRPPEVARSTETDRLSLPARPFALCLVGGGQDGTQLAEVFAAADTPPGSDGVLIAGPYMPDEAWRHLQACAARRSDLRLYRFVDDPSPLLARAERIVTMGGYNAVCEALSYDKPTLVVPRIAPRSEQLLRAEKLAALGLVSMLSPAALSAAAVGSWLRAPAAPPSAADRWLDFGGLEAIGSELERSFPRLFARGDGVAA